MKERRPAETIRFGLFWPYGQTTHIISRALADRNPDCLDAGLQQRLAVTAEEAGFDFLFIADAWWSVAGDRGHRSPLLEPTLLAALLFGATRHVGVITTIQPLVFHPAHVARAGATLDQLSRGRWGWNIVTADTPRSEALFGADGIDHDTRYAMAEEFLDAVEAIWASSDREPVDFEGRYYHLHGCLGAPRPVQRPHPLLLSAATSPVGQSFAARRCDYLFAAGTEAAQVRATADRLRDMAEGEGRPRGAVSVLVGPIVIIRDSADEAGAERAWIEEHADLDAAREVAMAQASHRGRLADDWRVSPERVAALASGRTHFYLVGTARDVAEQIIDLWRDGRPGGMLLSFPFWTPEETARFAQVTPHLREAGVWEPPAERLWSW